MVLTNKDKNFLLNSINQIKKMIKLFGKGIPENEVAFLTSIEPAIQNDNLNQEQIKFLIKNMQNVYLSTKVKYVKEVIKNLESMLETEEESVEK